MKPFALVLALGTLCSALLFGQAMEITMEKAVEMALASNLSLESSGIDLAVKKRARDLAWNVFLPQLSASARLSRSHDAPSSVSGFAATGAVGVPQTVIPYSVTPDHTFALSTSLSATLNLSITQIYSMRQTVLDHEAGLLSLENARKKLTRDVRKNFLNLLLLEENLRLMQKNLDATKTRVAIAQANYRSGLADEYTMLNAQVSLEMMKPAMEELTNGYRTAILSFKMLLGLDLAREISLKGRIEVPRHSFVVDSLITRAIQNKLELQSLAKSLEVLENAKALQMAALYPILSLAVTADPYFTKDPFAVGWFDSDANWKQRSGAFVISLVFPVDPLIPWSKQMNGIADTEDNIRKLKLSLEQLRDATELEIRSLVMRLEKSMGSLTTLELNVKLAERANKLGQDAYKAGLKDYSQIETAELQLRQAEFDVLREQYNYAAALLDLEYALNGTF